MYGFLTTVYSQHRSQNFQRGTNTKPNRKVSTDCTKCTDVWKGGGVQFVDSKMNTISSFLLTMPLIFLIESDDTIHRLRPCENESQFLPDTVD